MATTATTTTSAIKAGFFFQIFENKTQLKLKSRNEAKTLAAWHGDNERTPVTRNSKATQRITSEMIPLLFAGSSKRSTNLICSTYSEKKRTKQIAKCPLVRVPYGFLLLLSALWRNALLTFYINSGSTDFWCLIFWFHLRFISITYPARKQVRMAKVGCGPNV